MRGIIGVVLIVDTMRVHVSRLVTHGFNKFIIFFVTFIIAAKRKIVNQDLF